MSGGRPVHMGRRGAVYTVRFRVPADLAPRLGVAEVRKSLQTKDITEAKRRCAAAEQWFASEMERLRGMADPTRSDLEQAAREQFARLTLSVERPRNVPADDIGAPDGYVASQAVFSQERINEIDRQLVSNQYDPVITKAAEALADTLGVSLERLEDGLRIAALQLAARAERETMGYYVHQITSPAAVYKPMDSVFRWPPEAGRAVGIISHDANSPRGAIGPTLADAAEDFKRKQALRGLGKSHIEEGARALGWLQEELGPRRQVSSVTKNDLRQFRDKLERLDIQFRGRGAPFRDRLTNVTERQIKSVTSSRYWRSVQAFFAWCEAEGFIADSPATTLKIAKRKGEAPETPPPYTREELERLLATPLFTGYKSPQRLKEPGSYHQRNGRWWSLILTLFTGLRAGELSQLLPSDFAFDDAIPHLKVQEEDDQGRKVKTAKNAASIREVPIASVLLTLGLRQFVERQAKRFPKNRVFREFRMGRGRASDGMTKFWLAYLKAFDLWKPGRSTHVVRHTVVARLRELEVADQDIAAVVGHAGWTQTSRYGDKKYPLALKAKTVEKLEYGFDIIAALGGPYDAKRHGN